MTAAAIFAAILKNRKMAYPSNGLTDRRKIWHDDAFPLSGAFPPLKFPHFENPRWRRPPS